MSFIQYSFAYLMAICVGGFALWMMGPLFNMLGSFEGEDL